MLAVRSARVEDGEWDDGRMVEVEGSWPLVDANWVVPRSSGWDPNDAKQPAASSSMSGCTAGCVRD